MSSAPQKRKEGPGGSSASSFKRSKGGNASKWKTANHVAKEAEKVEMGYTLAAGDEGIWVTFARGMNAKAKREFITLCEEVSKAKVDKKSNNGKSANIDITKFGETLYGIQPSDKERDEDADEDKVLDKEASIEQELESMRATKPKSRKVFTVVNVDIECVFFVKTMKPVDPVELVLKICEDAAACSDPMKRRTRYINRLTPITNMDKATEKGIWKVARDVMAPHFSLVDEIPDAQSNPGDAEAAAVDTSKSSNDEEKPQHTVSHLPRAIDLASHWSTESHTIRRALDMLTSPEQYAIRHTVRRHVQLKSSAIIQKVASVTRPEHHKVDLTKPDKIVLVEVFKMFCGISVVDGSDWERFKRFNLNELYRATPEVTDEGSKEVPA